MNRMMRLAATAALLSLFFAAPPVHAQPIASSPETDTAPASKNAPEPTTEAPASNGEETQPDMPVIAELAAKAASPIEPLRVHIICETPWSRTKTCPAFLQGFVDSTPLLLEGPRSAAQVVIYVSINAVANDDRVHLRFVGELKQAPASIEVDVDVDTRANDDTQRAQLEPAFKRGIALYLAVLHPESVEIEFKKVQAPVAPRQTTPWGFALSLSGFGNFRGRYQSYNAWSNATVSRVTNCEQLALTLGVNGGLSKSPPLVTQDGEEISLDTKSWGTSYSLAYSRNFSSHWAGQISFDAWQQDPKGQFRYGIAPELGIEFDGFRSDDPRGNVLAAGYFFSYRTEGYNFPNEYAERFAHFPAHRLAAYGSVRVDTLSLGLRLEFASQLLDPARRMTLTVAPEVTWQIGDHVDLSLNVTASARRVPEPQIPLDDYAALSRGDYAEPFTAWGSVSVTIHWDRSNGARNNRFDFI